MTYMEVYSDANTEKVSLITKLLMWKYFINVALPLLSSFYFSYLGNFDDFTPKWY